MHESNKGLHLVVLESDHIIRLLWDHLKKKSQLDNQLDEVRLECERNRIFRKERGPPTKSTQEAALEREDRSFVQAFEVKVRTLISHYFRSYDLYCKQKRSVKTQQDIVRHHVGSALTTNSKRLHDEILHADEANTELELPTHPFGCSTLSVDNTKLHKVLSLLTP